MVAPTVPLSNRGESTRVSCHDTERERTNLGPQEEHDCTNTGSTEFSMLWIGKKLVELLDCLNFKVGVVGHHDAFASAFGHSTRSSWNRRCAISNLQLGRCHTHCGIEENRILQHQWQSVTIERIAHALDWPRSLAGESSTYTTRGCASAALEAFLGSQSCVEAARPVLTATK